MRFISISTWRRTYCLLLMLCRLAQSAQRRLHHLLQNPRTTLDSLPPVDTTRWVVRRKAEVVAAVNGGLLSVDEACARYSLTLEEFAGWQHTR